MAYTEFCCRNGGSNLNAGTRTGNSTEPGTSASFTYASGNWVAATGVFTVASGNPSTDGVAVGDFVSVYANGATETGFVGRVTAVSSTTITVSLTAKAGTPPTDGTGNRTLKVGGAWTGPNGAVGFPFGFIEPTLINTAGYAPRVNFKNDASYLPTATLTASVTGPIWWEGYTTSYGDGGRAVFDGGSPGTAFKIFHVSANFNALKNLEIKNNGTGGSAVEALNIAGRACCVIGVVVHDVRGTGILYSAGNGGWMLECEVYNANGANTAGHSAFVVNGGAVLFVRCFAHDNAGSNVHGFLNSANTLIILVDCVTDGNGGDGVRDGGNSGVILLNCTVNGNTGRGMAVAGFGGSMPLVENTTFLSNGSYGIQDDAAAGAVSIGVLNNNGFGSGIGLSNTSGNTSLPTVSSYAESGAINVTADPYIDRVGGNFNLNFVTGGGVELRGTGKGSFTQTQAGYSGTISYPDIGASQHYEPTPAEIAEAVWEWPDRQLTS